MRVAATCALLVAGLLAGVARAQEEGEQADLSGLIAAAASDAAAVAALEAFTSGGGAIERDEGEAHARDCAAARLALAWGAAACPDPPPHPPTHPRATPPRPRPVGAAKEAVEVAMGHGWWDASAKLIEASAAAGVDVSTTVHQTSTSIQKKLQHLKDQLSRGASVCVRAARAVAVAPPPRACPAGECPAALTRPPPAPAPTAHSVVRAGRRASRPRSSGRSRPTRSSSTSSLRTSSTRPPRWAACWPRRRRRPRRPGA